MLVVVVAFSCKNAQKEWAKLKIAVNLLESKRMSLSPH